MFETREQMLIHHNKAHRHFFTCPTVGCKESFMSEGTMLSHFQRAHNNPVKCRAAACVDSFANMEDMMKHWEKCHKTPSGFPCFNPGCSKKFKTLADTINHSKEPHLGCKIAGCRDMFQTKQTLITHLFKKHSCCGICKEMDGCIWTFKDRWEVEEHFRGMFGGHYYCWLCSELFLDREQFEAHHGMRHRSGESFKEEVE